MPSTHWIAAVVLIFLPTNVLGAEPQVEECLECHGDRDVDLGLADGSTVSLFVDRDALAGSVHGRSLGCLDCHADMEEVPHPERDAADLAAFRAGFRDACKPCHFDKYALSLDGAHYHELAKGNAKAPWCVDCHGAHDTAKPGVPRARVSTTCSRCHAQVYADYRASVHGRALVQDLNGDVPVCTDCHRSHDIADPRTESWLVQSPQLCGKCHADERLMAKYGLSTSVLDTYLADFHGTTVKLKSSGKSGTNVRLAALCIDCHGVHDISKADDVHSPVLKQNLVKTCRKCHEGASESFPDAWLSHYEPSMSKAPLVYAVTLFYRIFIPIVVGGLVLQILLHLWRVVVNR